MAEKEQEKTLEMRVAELEDKLSRLSLSEDEIKTLQKVYGAGEVQAQAPGALCGISQCFRPCIIYQCIINQCIQQCIINQCIQQCIFECSCGPCIAGGMRGGFGGGFGGLGR